jgi:hypothetical protein
MVIVCIFKSDMRLFKGLNTTLFFLFLSLFTHGYNTQILLTNDQHLSPQKKCISKPNIEKSGTQEFQCNLLNRKNKSAGLEISILAPLNFTTQTVFCYCEFLMPCSKVLKLLCVTTSNPKRGPPLV